MVKKKGKKKSPKRKTTTKKSKVQRKLPKIWEVGRIKTMPDGSVRQLTAKGGWKVLSKAPKKTTTYPIPKPKSRRATKADVTELHRDHNRLVLKVSNLERKLKVCTTHLLAKNKSKKDLERKLKVCTTHLL